MKFKRLTITLDLADEPMSEEVLKDCLCARFNVETRHEAILSFSSNAVVNYSTEVETIHE